jgi:hypothetical protein
MKFNGGICGQIRACPVTGRWTTMQAQCKTSFRTVDASDILLPEPERRRRIEPNATRRDTIEDAVFEVIDPKSARRHRINDNPPPPPHVRRATAALPLATRLSVGAVALVERQLLKMSPQAFSTLLVTVFFAVFWLCGGFSALRPDKMVPQASTVEAKPFEIRNTSVSIEDANGMKVLSVTGTIANTSAVTRKVPVLLALGADKKTEYGRIALPLEEIGPSITVGFSGRFKLVGGKVDDIVIIPQTR